MNNKELWTALVEFVIHVVVGAIAFFVVSLMAILLSIWVEYLEHEGYNEFIVKGLAGFEYFVFCMDLMLGAAFLIASTWKLVRKIYGKF